MAGKEQEITLVGVDSNGIRPHGSGEGFRVPFKLSGVPDGRWKKALEDALKTTISASRTPAFISGDTIIVTMQKGERQQDQVDYLKRAIAETYKVIQGEKQEAAARTAAVRERAEETERQVDALRDEANKLEF
jgi:hypothetical protein